MENYYAGFGETWERLALIQARGICGSEELAYEFLQHHQPFIYPKSPTPDLLDEIAALKRRIERDIVGHENLERDVKLGAGGIREIEFIVQALQLVHGARNTFLQETSTLKALPALAQHDLLPRDETMALDGAYRFLRRVEHRLQIEAEQQTHTIPDDPESLASAGAKSRLPVVETTHDRSYGATWEMCARFSGKMSLIHAKEPAAAAPSYAIFRDQARAEKSFSELAQGPARFHVAPRTRQVFRKLRPLLLQQLAKTADPDATLNQLLRFVEAYGLRSLLFELLAVNPRLLELLIKTFDVSRYAGDLLVRHPQLLEETTRSRKLDQPLEVGATSCDVSPAAAHRPRNCIRCARIGRCIGFAFSCATSSSLSNAVTLGARTFRPGGGMPHLCQPHCSLRMRA